MKMRTGIILLVLITCLGNTYRLLSQDTILGFGEAMRQVRSHHPVANAARLGPEIAKAQLMKARGNFDPVGTGSISQKYFDSKQYYSLQGGQIKLPTRVGIDLMAGYESNGGVFLNQEASTPPGGLWYGGVSVPLGQGLLIDESRADLWTSRLSAQNAILNQQNMTNDLLYEASELYWEWFRSYHVMKIAEEAYANATQRFQAIKRYAGVGDRSMIDTTEAMIQIRNISILLDQARLDLAKTQRYFSGYFWDENGSNKGLSSNENPENTDRIFAEILGDQVTGIEELDFFDQQNHPYLRQLVNKIEQLDIERRLKRDKLKPKADLKYIPLAQNTGSNTLSQFSINNYRWGLEFKMPLFLRKERGDLKLAELKVREADLFYRYKSTELYNKFNNKITEWQVTTDQIRQSQQAVELYSTMLTAETRLFESGESSVFLINAREQALINSRIKLMELLAKNRSAYYGIFYLAGKLASSELE